MITRKELDDLEDKYYPSTSILTVQTDDTKPIYILKGGRAAGQRVSDMRTDIIKLIRELRGNINRED